jgi:dTDP-glucose 4,6-dehydratase
MNNEPIPIYGKGENIRDWLYVGEHATAIDTVFHTGTPGETYNVGGNMEMTNIDLVYTICDMMYERGYTGGDARKLIKFVTDRPGHDFRYAIDSSKIAEKLRWAPYPDLFRRNLLGTIDWFAEIYNKTKE